MAPAGKRGRGGKASSASANNSNSNVSSSSSKKRPAPSSNSSSNKESPSKADTTDHSKRRQTSTTSSSIDNNSKAASTGATDNNDSNLPTPAYLISCDIPTKQYIQYLNEQIMGGPDKKFILQDLDATHLLIKLSAQNDIDRKLDIWFDENIFSAIEKVGEDFDMS